MMVEVSAGVAAMVWQSAVSHPPLQGLHYKPTASSRSVFRVVGLDFQVRKVRRVPAGLAPLCHLCGGGDNKPFSSFVLLPCPPLQPRWAFLAGRCLQACHLLAADLARITVDFGHRPATRPFRFGKAMDGLSELAGRNWGGMDQWHSAKEYGLLRASKR